MSKNTNLSEVAAPLVFVPEGSTFIGTTEDGSVGYLERHEPNTGDRLQDAFDEIAVLHGRLDEKTETIGVAFGTISELYARVERLEAGQHT